MLTKRTSPDHKTCDGIKQQLRFAIMAAVFSRKIFIRIDHLKNEIALLDNCQILSRHRERCWERETLHHILQTACSICSNTNRELLSSLSALFVDDVAGDAQTLQTSHPWKTMIVAKPPATALNRILGWEVTGGESPRRPNCSGMSQGPL